MVCGCCADKRKGELFKPHRERGCTDVVCLLLLIVAVGGLAAISYVAISAHPSLVDDLIYPTDSYGNNCGKPGTDTADLSKVLYPDLDSDIIAHAGLIATGQYLTFLTSVTRLCAHTCPAGVSLRGPSIYGGSGYPGGANATVPEHTYAFTTQDVFGRCFPLSSAFAEATSELCVQPECTDPALNATLGGTVRCASLSDRPEETTTWELCATGTAAGLCAAQRGACEYSVQRAPLVSYLPEGASDGSTAATQELASQVQLLVGAADGVLEVSTCTCTCDMHMHMSCACACAPYCTCFTYCTRALCIHSHASGPLPPPSPPGLRVRRHPRRGAAAPPRLRVGAAALLLRRRHHLRAAGAAHRLHARAHHLARLQDRMVRHHVESKACVAWVPAQAKRLTGRGWPDLGAA